MEKFVSGIRNGSRNLSIVGTGTEKKVEVPQHCVAKKISAFFANQNWYLISQSEKRRDQHQSQKSNPIRIKAKTHELLRLKKGGS
jgi:hypothetical protein